MKKLITVLALCLSLASLSMTGCIHNPPVAVPGQINTFDATTYRVLMDAQAALDTVKAHIADGTFVPTPTQTRAFNDFIKSYNALEAGWQLYHASQLGAPTQAQIQDLTANVNNSTAMALSSGLPVKGAK